jgi:hypothetical protein
LWWGEGEGSGNGQAGRAACACARVAKPSPSPHFFISLAHTPQALQAALRAGQVDAVKKHAAGSNRAHGVGPGKDAAKLDRETEELSHER